MTLPLLEKSNLRTPPRASKKTSGASIYQVRVIRQFEAFLPLKAEWDGFLKQAGIENLCMTHGWISTWLQHFPAEELLIVIVQDQQNRWVGAAPLKISKGSHGLAQKKLRHLQFIGTQPSVYDWMKIAILPGEDETAIIRELAAVIKKSRWDLLDLQFMPEQAQCRMLCEFLNPAEAETAIVSKTTIPYVELPDTTEEYEKVRRKKTRWEVNRHCNRFASEYGAPLELEFQTTNEVSDVYFSDFIKTHMTYWADRGQKSDFQRFPNLSDFYRNMLNYSAFQAEADEPKLLFSVLKLNDYQLSYHFGFWQGSGYLGHLTGFNQQFRSFSPGIVHMDKLVFDTIERGGRVFELGRGDEPYKKMWTKTQKPLWNLRLFRHPLARLLWDFDQQLKKLLGKPVE